MRVNETDKNIENVQDDEHLVSTINDESETSIEENEVVDELPQEDVQIDDNVEENSEIEKTGELVFSDVDEIPRKRRRLTINIMIAILLIASLTLLVLSMYAYKNRETIQENAKPTVQPASISETTPVPTALPESLTSTSSLTVLVNKTHSLPSDYVPENLATPYLNSTTDIIQVNEEAGNQAKQMMADAAEQGITLVVTAGYRSYSEQEIIYQDRVDLLGEEQANRQIEKAGYSEHQTGLALDFTDDPTKIYVSSEFGETDAGKWLYEHAHEYGFILRYPNGKESITGYDYNPNHYRYVGVETATAIYNVDPDETFEEYFQINN